MKTLRNVLLALVILFALTALPAMATRPVPRANGVVWDDNARHFRIAAGGTRGHVYFSSPVGAFTGIVTCSGEITPGSDVYFGGVISSITGSINQGGPDGFVVRVQDNGRGLPAPDSDRFDVTFREPAQACSTEPGLFDPTVSIVRGDLKVR